MKKKISSQEAKRRREQAQGVNFAGRMQRKEDRENASKASPVKTSFLTPEQIEQRFGPRRKAGRG